MKEIKETIYNDARLLEILFNNVGFNLHECAVTHEEMDDITKFRRILERDLVGNISMAVRSSTEITLEGKVKENVKSLKKIEGTSENKE